MMCLINYLSACRRLKECDKFIQLNRKNGIPDQILAQRDMIKLEMEYYKDEVKSFLGKAFWTSIFIAFVGGNLAIYFKFFAN